MKGICNKDSIKDAEVIKKKNALAMKLEKEANVSHSEAGMHDFSMSKRQASSLTKSWNSKARQAGLTYPFAI